MNGLQKHSRWVAFLLSVAAFGVGFVITQMVCVMGPMCWYYAQEVEQPQMRLEPFDVFFCCLGFAMGLVSARFVFRVCRGSVSPQVLFHVVFGIGLSLLCFCLWLMIISMPLLNSPLVFDWSTQVLSPLLTAPLICLALIPMAGLLLSYAILIDRNAQER